MVKLCVVFHRVRERTYYDCLDVPAGIIGIVVRDEDRRIARFVVGRVH